MPDWLAIIILGIIEGITEFLPISSTGHLLLAESTGWIPRQSDLFNVVIQSGAVLAVLPLFPERLRQVLAFGRDAKARDFVLKVGLAFGVTAIGGFILEKRGLKLPENVLPVALALLIGGILFVLVENWLRGRPTSTEISWAVAGAVGAGQLVAAVFPGTSRSGATILIMLGFGLSRPAATEFSFLVGIPTMLAAGGFKIFKALHHAQSVPGAPAENWALLGLCTLISAVVSFKGFGWYRIVVGGVLLLFLLRH